MSNVKRDSKGNVKYQNEERNNKAKDTKKRRKYNSPLSDPDNVMAVLIKD